MILDSGLLFSTTVYIFSFV